MPLARYVPEDYRLYGLQSRGLSGGQLPGSVKEMAADYIAQIRGVQPAGPYHLLGYSSGAIVAHEIAVQLRAEGEPVAALVLLDGYPGREQKPAAGPAPVPAGPVAAAGPDAAPGASLGERVRAEAGQVLGAISDDEVALLTRVYEHNARLTAGHEFSQFDGGALLLVAAIGKAGSAQAPRWRPYITGEITEVLVECEHLEITRPERLAEIWPAISSRLT
jgi:thioesterase domain-containing protein